MHHLSSALPRIPALPVLFGAASLLFGALFWADLQGYFRITRSPIASLERAIGTVRRLPNGEWVWDRASQGTFFGAGDTISTGDFSGARIAFLSGGSIELEAGTMVVVGSDSNELKLNFLSGGGKVHLPKAAEKKITVTRGAPVAARSSAKTAGRSLATARKKAPAPVLPKDKTGEAASRIEIVEHRETPPAAQTPPTTPQPLTKAEPMAPIREALIKETVLKANPLTRNELVDARTGLLAIQELPPVPDPVFPKGDLTVTARSNAALEWSLPRPEKSALRPDPIQGFELALRSKGSQADSAESIKILKADETRYSLENLPPGNYLWSVRTIGQSGKRSPASPTRAIEIRAVPGISKPRIVSAEVEIEKPSGLTVEVE